MRTPLEKITGHIEEISEILKRLKDQKKWDEKKSTLRSEATPMNVVTALALISALARERELTTERLHKDLEWIFREKISRPRVGLALSHLRWEGQRFFYDGETIPEFRDGKQIGKHCIISRFNKGMDNGERGYYKTMGLSLEVFIRIYFRYSN